MPDQGVPLKGQEACARLGNITAAFKMLRRPPSQLTERHQGEGVLASSALASSSAAAALPWWGLTALGHSDFFKCFQPYKAVYANYYHWAWECTATTHNLKQWSPTFSAPGTSFVEGNFSMDQRFRDDSSTSHLLCTLFLSIIIISAPLHISRHQISEVGEPWP